MFSKGNSQNVHILKIIPEEKNERNITVNTKNNLHLKNLKKIEHDIFSYKLEETTKSKENDDKFSEENSPSKLSDKLIVTSLTEKENIQNNYESKSLESITIEKFLKPSFGSLDDEERFQWIINALIIKNMKLMLKISPLTILSPSNLMELIRNTLCKLALMDFAIDYNKDENAFRTKYASIYIYKIRSGDLYAFYNCLIVRLVFFMRELGKQKFKSLLYQLKLAIFFKLENDAFFKPIWIHYHKALIKGESPYRVRYIHEFYMNLDFVYDNLLNLRRLSRYVYKPDEILYDLLPDLEEKANLNEDDDEIFQLDL